MMRIERCYDLVKQRVIGSALGVGFLNELGQQGFHRARQVRGNAPGARHELFVERQIDRFAAGGHRALQQG